MGFITSNFVALLLLLLLASTAKCQPGAGVFDILKYGAKPNTDVTQVSVYN